MTFDELPAVSQFSAKTLKILYKDGAVLKVPYFDRDSALSFLSMEDDIMAFTVEDAQYE